MQLDTQKHEVSQYLRSANANRHAEARVSRCMNTRHAEGQVDVEVFYGMARRHATWHVDAHVSPRMRPEACETTHMRLGGMFLSAGNFYIYPAILHHFYSSHSIETKAKLLKDCPEVKEGSFRVLISPDQSIQDIDVGFWDLASRFLTSETASELGKPVRSRFRHPNTIAYPEKFFESAQAIAAHSQLCWPDLSREWIRLDWESSFPCVLGPRKSRLPLFTRKQQRLLDRAREMDGVPDLSALLKGKLQLLTKKSTTVDPQGPSNSGVDVTSEGGGTSREGASKEGASREEGPIAIDQGGRAETSASGPKKKKKTKRTKVGATNEVPPEESTSLDATSEGSKAKKKKDGRKRSRGGAASSADRGEGLAEGQEAVLVGAASDGHPRKRTKRSVEAEPCPSTSDVNAADATLVDAVGEASGAPENLSEERRSGSEGSVAKRKRIEFPDRVEFSYNETSPLILNPLRCAELTRQIRGGTKEMP
ncbi:hypothetical protein F2Q69_00024111 [Brassica cretica]|uniref:Uncharacterized protein n=1 Tax=Brassica cretica TaxID=69181 RepID=A0A8S9Q361_BRACR|nr:hypothetical protein F2Q69_00024111 [Brassica cretica]